MHYNSIENNHNLPHDPFKAIVAPRPIGWIGTNNSFGEKNLAPYSFFNAVSDKPHYVMFSSTGYKDSIKNVEETKEFTCSLATEELFVKMNNSSASVKYEVDEFELTNLTPEKGKYVNAPYVKESPAALECKLWKVIDIPGSDRKKGTGHFVVFGHVIGIYINESFINNGFFNTAMARPLGRLGYMDFGVITENNVVTKKRPEIDDKGNIIS